MRIIKRKDARKTWYNIIVGEMAGEESRYMERMWLYTEVDEEQSQYMLPGEGEEGKLIPISCSFQVEGERVGAKLEEDQRAEAILFGLGYKEGEDFQWVREFIYFDIEENEVYFTDPWTGERYQLWEGKDGDLLASMVPPEEQLYPGLTMEGIREALGYNWAIKLDEEGNWVASREGKAIRRWNPERDEWEIILPFEVELERGEYRQMKDSEVEQIRQGLKDEERAAELKDGNGFIMRLPETGQLIAVVTPKIMKIGDLEDPNPDLYPDYREIKPGVLDEILMDMRPEVEGENWDDRVEDGRTENLIVVQISFITEGMTNEFLRAGHLPNTAIDKEILPNTAVHLLMFDRNDFQTGEISNYSQARYEELMREFNEDIKFEDSYSNLVVNNVAQVIVMGQLSMRRNLNKNASWYFLFVEEGYPFYAQYGN